MNRAGRRGPEKMTEETRTIGILLSNPADRRLLTDFVTEMGYLTHSPSLQETNPDKWAELDMIIADETGARRHREALLNWKTRSETIFRPLLILLPSGARSDPWLMDGFDDVLRVPLTGADLRARLEMFLRLQAQSRELARRSEMTFHTLMEQSPVGICMLGTEGFLHINQAMADMFGYRPDEVVGRLGPLDLVHPDDRQLVREILQQRLSGGEAPPLRIGFRGRRQDGETIHCELFTTGIEYQGRPVALSILVDTTELVRAEQARTRQKAGDSMVARIYQALVRGEELEPALEAALQAVVAILGDDVLGVYLLDKAGERLLRRGSPLPDELALRIEELVGLDMRRISIPLPEDSHFQQVLVERRTLLLNEPDDLAALFNNTANIMPPALHENLPALTRLLARRYRSVLIAPLVSSEQVVGLIDLYSPVRLEEQDRLWFERLAAQIGIAIEQARTSKREQRLQERLSLVWEIGQRARAILDVDLLLRETVRAVQTGFGYHDILVALVDDAAGELVSAAEAGTYTELPWQRKPLDPERGIVDWVALHGETMLVNDVRREPRYIKVWPETQAELCVPIKCGDRVLGVLNIESTRPDAFDQIDATAMETLADHLAAAIENARLYEQAQREIAARARAEQKLRQANRIVENSPMVLFRWRAEEGWPVELVSENVIQFGYTPAEFLSGETPYISVIYPEDRERVGQEVQECSASGGDSFERKYRIITKDGRVRWIDDRTVIERDAEGRITHYQGIVIDITERVQAEEELRKLSQAVEQSANTVIITDLEGNIEYVNPKFEETTGYTAAEALGQNPRILKSGEHPESFYRQLWGTITSGREWRGELCNRRKDGTLYWEQASIAPVYDATGRMTHFIAIKEDITARKEVEKTLQRRIGEQEALYAVATAASSSLDPNTVLSTVLDTVLLVMGSTAGWIELPGPTLDDPPRLVAHRGLPDEFVAAEESLPLRSCPVCAPLLEGAAIQNEPMLCTECPRLPRKILDRSGLHSHVGIPLSAGERTMGVLNVGWCAPRPYMEAERALLTAIGRQVGLALQNAQLYQRARQVDRLRALNELDRALSATLDPDVIIETTLQQVAAAVDAPMAGLFVLPVPKTTPPSLGGVSDQNLLGGVSDRSPSAAVGDLAERNGSAVRDRLQQPFMTENAACPERIFALHRGWVEMSPSELERKRFADLLSRLTLSRGPLPLSSDEWAALSDSHRLITRRWGTHGLILPVFDNARLLAVLVLGGRPAEQPFTDEDLSLAQTAVARAAQAIQNAYQHQAVVEAEARYRELYHGVPVGLYRLAPDARFLIVNRAMVNIMGYPDAETLLALKASDLYVNVEQHRRIMAIMEQQTGAQDFEVLLRRYDGSTMWAQVNIRTVRDESGEVMYYEGSLMDITTRKRAEEELRQSKIRLAEAQRIAHLGSWDWNIPTNELSWSDETYRIFGLAPQEFRVTYDAFLKTVHPDDREMVTRSVSRAMHEGQSYTVDYRILLPDGSERIVHEQGEVSFNEVGRPARMVGTVQDITTRMRLEERLTAIYQLGRELTLLHDEDVIIQHLLEATASVIQLNMLALGLVDEEAGELVYRRHLLDGAVEIIDLHLPLDGERSIGVAVVREGRAINVPAVGQDDRYIPVGDRTMRSELCVPMRIGERVVGVLNAESVRPAHFTLADEQLLQTLADQAAVALENARLYRVAKK
ncbi:MAG TPA: PAS domain S-box protein, partial [Chloroflexi bacterium]|nr:PAS domain S-box protein [Chloroflexota bacterium]